MKTGKLTKLTTAFTAGFYGLISLNQSFAESPTSNKNGITAPAPILAAPDTDDIEIIEQRGKLHQSYSCDIFVDPDQRIDCQRKQGDELAQFKQEGQGGSSLETKSETSSAGVSDSARQKQNQAVLNQLYKNIYLFNSGVFNYEKKIN